MSEGGRLARLRAESVRARSPRRARRAFRGRPTPSSSTSASRTGTPSCSCIRSTAFFRERLRRLCQGQQDLVPRSHRGAARRLRRDAVQRAPSTRSPPAVATGDATRLRPEGVPAGASGRTPPLSASRTATRTAARARAAASPNAAHAHGLAFVEITPAARGRGRPACAEARGNDGRCSRDLTSVARPRGAASRSAKSSTDARASSTPRTAASARRTRTATIRARFPWPGEFPCEGPRRSEPLPCPGAWG